MVNEKRLVDANALLEKLKKTSRYFTVKFDIEEAPTVDAVEVVRCGKCKNFRPYEGEEHKGDCAELVGLESCVYEDDFCSYGERKEGAN